jgi:homocysteine S-methyltransferase
MKHRGHLPQLDGGVFLTDGGLETDLIFHEGLDLPAFAAFDLLKDEDGTRSLRRYYQRYAELARAHLLGFVLESPTWRASPRWAAEIGYTDGELERFNRKAISLMAEIRDEHEADGPPIVISGCVGPQDDGYRPAAKLSADAARDYHRTQIETFADTEADMITALTLTYADEAIGVTLAAAAAGLPAAISFTVETDGRLPSGQTLGEAIGQVDEETDGEPAYYMVNCSHPQHFEHVLPGDEPWLERIYGLRANASTRSHAELDEAAELDEGDPEDLASRYVELGSRLPRLSVLGGCCGTDHRHVEAICRAWLAAAAL